MKRQQWGNEKQEIMTTVWNGQFHNEPTDSNGLEPDIARDDVMDGGGVDEEEARPRMDSLESRYSSSEETDSLLHLVRQHFVDIDERPRYRVSQLLSALKTLSLGNRQHVAEPAENSPLGLSENPVGRKVPKTERTVTEELLTQNEELRNHLVQLFKVLDSCESENQKLKETVSDLRRQLEEYRAHRVVRDEEHFGLTARSSLDTPFSLMEGFVCTPPSESLPPLAPLHIPHFEDMN